MLKLCVHQTRIKMQAVTITQITPTELETLIDNSIMKFLSAYQPTPHPKTDELLTVQDTAKFLTLSVPTVYGLISKGAIPCMKRSKRVYFSKAELINYLQQGKKKTVCDLEVKTDAFLSTCKKKGVSHA